MSEKLLSTPDHNDGSPAGMRRRSVLAAGAWTAPAIVAVGAAPAFAATGCPAGGYRYLLNWATATLTPVSGGFTVTVVPTNGTAANAVTLKVTNAMIGGATAISGNMAVSGGGIGGTGARGLTLTQNTPTNANSRRNYRQEVSFEFVGATVTNLSFMITDIDSANGDFQDRVELDPAFTGTPAHTSGDRVTGSGTQASPWQLNDGDSPQDNGSGTRGNVTVTRGSVAAPFKLTYWNAENNFNTNNSQTIYLTNFTFTKPC